jgi:hypothetical protein
MRYEGRSPINDVVRAVVVGAAMIPPALLVACSGGDAKPPEVPLPPDPNGDPRIQQVAGDPDAGVMSKDAGAPDPSVVRPRGGDGNGHPTRGFRGHV